MEQKLVLLLKWKEEALRSFSWKNHKICTVSFICLKLVECVGCKSIEQHILDTNAGKQLSLAAIDI